MKEIIVSHSPFMHSKNDVNKLFLYVCLALVFPAIFGIALGFALSTEESKFLGLNALFTIIFCIAFCGAFEIGFNYYFKKKFELNDISFVVTGLVLALTLPYNTPFYALLICSFVSICVVKIPFGGLGRNYFNPALVGRCVAGIVIPDITSSLYKITIAGDEYISLTQEGGENTIVNLITGRSVGGIGTTCILLLLVVFVVLSVMKVIDFKIVILSVISYFLTAYFLTGFEQATFNLFSGSFIFVAIFMMTEPNISPNTLLGTLVYSISFGVLSAFAWHYNNYLNFGENCVFVVAMIVNLFVPFMDKYLVSKPSTIGGYRNAHKV